MPSRCPRVPGGRLQCWTKSPFARVSLADVLLSPLFRPITMVLTCQHSLEKHGGRSLDVPDFIAPGLATIAGYEAWTMPAFEGVLEYLGIHQHTITSTPSPADDGDHLTGTEYEAWSVPAFEGVLTTWRSASVLDKVPFSRVSVSDALQSTLFPPITCSHLPHTHEKEGGRNWGVPDSAHLHQHYHTALPHRTTRHQVRPPGQPTIGEIDRSPRVGSARRGGWDAR